MMKNMFVLAIGAARETMVFKVNVVGGVLALIMFYGLQFMFFDVINTFVAVEGDEWLLLFFMTFSVGSLMVDFFGASITAFFGHVVQGRADALLVRPVSLFSMVLLRESKFTYAVVALLIVVAFLVSRVGAEALLFESWTHVVLYFFCLMAGVVASICFLLGVNSIAFITQRELPVDFIHSELSSFGVVPSGFYPTSVFSMLMVFLPMIVFASVAMEALYEGMTWLVCAYFFTVLVLMMATRRVVATLFDSFDSVGG
ncbi:ABC-2 family transporter protein [Pseudomonas sp. R5(2019)]|uniref:ABC-2 family transporter protein n=1 Tax=Pseudomonas sp. R5(2019) TaxID=2697566 RepID=UPI0014126920|nr:ABC-2 family transporter protein [Pseudomonas sp. R5(2019)]NBA97157.1 hypothetical protein [Pseudomonas sp. R5(2019)]